MASRRLKLWATLIAIFLAGVVVGGGVTVLVGRHIVKDRIQAVMSGDEKHLVEKVMHGLAFHLSLSSAQRERIKPIVERAVADAMAIKAQVQPRVMAILTRAVEEARPILDPDQQAKVDRRLNTIGVPPKVTGESSGSGTGANVIRR